MTTDHVHLTWQLDIETVQETNIDAMQVLSYASLTASRNIPERLLQPLVFGDVSAYWSYRLSINTLASYSLIDVSENNEGSSLYMHSLVQSTVLERVLQQPEELHYRLSRMSYYLLSLLPERGNLSRQLKDDQFISLIPHLYAVAEKAVWMHNDELCMSLVDYACWIAVTLVHVDVAAFLCSEYLKASDISVNFKQHCRALHVKGYALRHMADPQSAQLHFMKELQLIEGCSKHETWLKDEYERTLGELATCYRLQEMFMEAENTRLAQLTLLNEEPICNKDLMISALQEVGQDFFASGTIEKAVESYEKMLDILTRDTDTDPVDLFQVLANLGLALSVQEHHEKALQVMERCLRVGRECLPRNSLDMARVLGRLSTCYVDVGNGQRALQLAEEASAIACQCLPSNHPENTQYMKHLSLCHYSTGNIDKAIDILEPCIEILRQSVPMQRTRLCAALTSLGGYYTSNERFDDAIEVLEECLQATRSFLPPFHIQIGYS
jgi:tetratricopeptide (TPR) repeat protein